MSLTPYIGYFFLTLGLAFTLVQAVSGFITQKHFWYAPAYKASCAAFYGLSGAFAALLWGHITSDFSMQNVYENSHTLKPMLYKISGAWGNHEGSMLLFAWMLSACGFIYSLRHEKDAAAKPFFALALAVQGGVIALLLSYIILVSNPFEVLQPVPEEGRGLNPLLQDIGLALHPPLLYSGYVLFSLVFAVTLAGMVRGNLTRAWAQHIRFWALLAQGLLTLGITMGAWWAYRELGWGGYWFWDPVENVSLLPWLTGASLLHTIVMVEKRQTLTHWVCLLAILTFSLCLMGFFLVRSGVLSSVHSFANDPSRGLFMLGILAVVMGGALWVFAQQAAKLKSTAHGAAFLSRDTGLLFNNLLLMTLCFTVFLGTLYPLFSEVVLKRHLSVGGPYFNTVFNPIALLTALLAAVTPWLQWKDNKLASVLTIVVPIMLVLLFGVALPRSLSMYGLLVGGLLAVSSVLEVLRVKLHMRTARAWGMSLAHLGLGVLVMAVSAQTEWKQSKELSMAVGQTATLGDITFTLEKLDALADKNYLARRGTFRVQVGNSIYTLFPEARIYPIEGADTNESAIHYGLWRDIYIVIGQQLGGDTKHPQFAVRAYSEPAMLWLWLGAGMMAAGALLAMRRK